MDATRCHKMCADPQKTTWWMFHKLGRLQGPSKDSALILEILAYSAINARNVQSSTGSCCARFELPTELDTELDAVACDRSKRTKQWKHIETWKIMKIIENTWFSAATSCSDLLRPTAAPVGCMPRMVWVCDVCVYHTASHPAGLSCCSLFH